MNRNTWTAAQKAAIAPFEGAAVSVVGFIVAVKKQYGGSGESTNCHFNKADFVDAHVRSSRAPARVKRRR